MVRVDYIKNFWCGFCCQLVPKENLTQNCAGLDSCPSCGKPIRKRARGPSNKNTPRVLTTIEC